SGSLPEIGRRRYARIRRVSLATANHGRDETERSILWRLQVSLTHLRHDHDPPFVSELFQFVQDLIYRLCLEGNAARNHMGEIKLSLPRPFQQQRQLLRQM